ncbi:MAG: bifunctional 4-hydroxy-2-oxoglutarate aldolase/2-dehydro-3-deoxy-phosphogluconate aldolase [Planctomycetota bacterium]|jgi:2-dehydro-3-deoxyphosphogluconate aldolase/(4S)-4-hydroxy-2-oxoglutarate aldolase|nr:bifunctional 4-hydroxy-2-oxoglutarate aldolase/2-dehydro-3-deoxy-phosphogluconate aldolase [Planctomycetota bacterium]
MDMRKAFRESPALAILRNIPLEKTIPYAQAAFAGGIRLFEVAMNSRDGLEQIERLRKHFGDSAGVGAGTVVNVDLAKAALAAGAAFLLAPSCPPEMLAWCAESRTAFLPGVLTPSEAGLCLASGFKVMKLFPAGDMPPGYVKSLKGPFNDSDYVAIGGVTPANAPDFIRAGYLGVGLGGNLMPRDCLENNGWDKAATGVRKMLAAMEEAACATK